MIKAETCLSKGTKLFQFRSKIASPETIKKISYFLKLLCEKYQAKWLINGEPQDAQRLEADGVHLTGKQLLALEERPLGDEFLIGASCHNSQELVHADRIGVDFVVLSPVNKTKSHPEIDPLGFNKFEDLIKKINIPVYALGGMETSDLEAAWQHGAQGIATMRAGWED